MSCRSARVAHSSSPGDRLDSQWIRRRQCGRLHVRGRCPRRDSGVSGGQRHYLYPVDRSGLRPRYGAVPASGYEGCWHPLGSRSRQLCRLINATRVDGVVEEVLSDSNSVLVLGPITSSAASSREALVATRKYWSIRKRYRMRRPCSSHSNRWSGPTRAWAASRPT